MKKIVITITLLVSALLILRFTPASQQKEIVIKNKIEHVNNYVNYPHNWIKWYPALKEAWTQDSNSIHTKENAAGKTFSFVLPGKEIQVTSVSGVEYHIQEAGNDAGEIGVSFFILMKKLLIQKLSIHSGVICYIRFCLFYKVVLTSTR